METVTDRNAASPDPGIQIIAEALVDAGFPVEGIWWLETPGPMSRELARAMNALLSAREAGTDGAR